MAASLTNVSLSVDENTSNGLFSFDSVKSILAGGSVEVVAMTASLTNVSTSVEKTTSNGLPDIVVVGITSGLVLSFNVGVSVEVVVKAAPLTNV